MMMLPLFVGMLAYPAGVRISTGWYSGGVVAVLLNTGYLLSRSMPRTTPRSCRLKFPCLKCSVTRQRSDPSPRDVPPTRWSRSGSSRCPHPSQPRFWTLQRASLPQGPKKSVNLQKPAWETRRALLFLDPEKSLIRVGEWGDEEVLSQPTGQRRRPLVGGFSKALGQ